MARQEELEIEIGPDGQVRVHVKGAAGPRCLEYVELFRQAVGPVTDEQLTPEFYEAEAHVDGQQKLHNQR